MATETATTTPLVSRGEAGGALPDWVRVYAKLLALFTYFVVVAGGIVTSTDSGLADPHWPSFDGRLLPSLEAMAEDRGKLFEHGHRLVAGSALLLTWGLTIVLWRSPARPLGARRLALAAALVGPIPAVFGGLTVRYELPPALSIVHVAAAMAFLSLNAAVAVAVGRRWMEAPAEARSAELLASEARWLAAAGSWLVVAVYVQIILGAIPRHAGVGVHPHILWAFGVITIAIMVAGRVFSRHGKLAGVFHAGAALLALAGAQLFLGFATFVSLPSRTGEARTVLSQVLASTHQAIGALMLAVAVVFLARALRLRRFALPGAAPVGEAPA